MVQKGSVSSAVFSLFVLALSAVLWASVTTTLSSTDLQVGLGGCCSCGAAVDAGDC